MKKKFLDPMNLPPLANPEELSPPDLSLPEPIENEPKRKGFFRKKQTPNPIPKAVVPVPKKPVHETHKSESKRPSPPIFVKVEKYKDIVENLHGLKTQAVGLRDTLEVLLDVEAELKRALDVTNRTLDSFNTLLSGLESQLTRVTPDEERVNLNNLPIKPPNEIDGFVKDLHEHIEKIKDELESIPTK